jgi:hypothetical protein
MGSSRRLLLLLLLTAPLVGVGEQLPAAAQSPGEPVATESCVIAPPRGPFDGPLEASSPPPTAKDLPVNAGAWSTLITPGPRHRWVPQTGLVESADGALLLHGVAKSPVAGADRLNVLVLADYAPLESVHISVWNAERSDRLDEVDGAIARVPTDETAVAFDIELPRDSVTAGHYREIQTLVWLEHGPIDARRWTVYAGPEPPAERPCVFGDAPIVQMPSRARIGNDGRLVVRSPRATTLAVVPLRTTGAGTARFLRIDEAGRGWEGMLADGAELAAVWEGPFSGPGRSWISSFWSTRSQSQTQRPSTLLQ